MLPLYERIESLCKSSGVNLTEMCRSADIPRSALSDYKMGRKKSINLKNLEKISDYFGISLDELMGRQIDESAQNKSDLYKVLSDLCAERGITGYQMCKDIGIQPSIMTDLKMGRKNGADTETTNKIASYFGVSVGYLLGEEQKEKLVTKRDDELTDEESELFRLLRASSPAKRSAILALLKDE